MKFYEIKFITKKGGEKSWIIHIEAANAKEAKQKMLIMWGFDRRFEGMHPFGIKTKKLPDTEEFRYHYFVQDAE